MATKWMGDRYVLGFAPALRFLLSQILCRLYKSPSDETINRGPPCVYACKKIAYVCYRSCSPGDHGNTQITQHVLKMSVFRMSKLDPIQEKKKKHCEQQMVSREEVRTIVYRSHAAPQGIRSPSNMQISAKTYKREV